MLRIPIILSILSIYVDSTAPNEDHKHAVSSQSFHRDDVPLSYKFTSVHMYTTPHPERSAHHEQVNPPYHIQYAPLSRDTHPQNVRQQATEPEHSTEAPKKDLEPRAEAENLDDHGQYYRSYVPAHNIEVLQSKRLNYKHPYNAYHDLLQRQKDISPKFSIYRQQPTNNLPDEQLNFAIQDIKEQRPRSQTNNILYTYLPKQQYGHITNMQHVIQPMEKPQNLHQALTGKAPRLHLNIARVYGIAHMPEQAPINFRGPQSHTQGFFFPFNTQQNPKKTILYPVQDTRKNYPTQIVQ